MSLKFIQPLNVRNARNEYQLNNYQLLLQYLCSQIDCLLVFQSNGSTTEDEKKIELIGAKHTERFNCLCPVTNGIDFFR